VIASVAPAVRRGCTRARLSAEGSLYTWPRSPGGHDLRGRCAAEASDEALAPGRLGWTRRATGLRAALARNTPESRRWRCRTSAAKQAAGGSVKAGRNVPAGRLEVERPGIVIGLNMHRCQGPGGSSPFFSFSLAEPRSAVDAVSQYGADVHLRRRRAVVICISGSLRGRAGTGGLNVISGESRTRHFRGSAKERPTRGCAGCRRSARGKIRCWSCRRKQNWRPAEDLNCEVGIYE